MTSKEIRAIARQNLAGRWPVSIAAAALAFLMGGIIIGSSFIPQMRYSVEIPDTGNLTDLLYSIQEQLPENTGLFATLNGALGFLAFIVGGAVEIGYATYLLRQHDGRDPQAGDVLCGFDRFGIGFVQKLLRSIYIALWSLLLIIPGIVAHYRYAMTPFILAENPDMTASEAIHASKAMMLGHKGELFVLDLSFIGWAILASLPWNLGHLVLNPYRGAAHAVFYRNLKG